MGVYISVGAATAAGPTLRHLRGDCENLMSARELGARTEYVRNTVKLRARTERCPHCFVDLPALPAVPSKPRFLAHVKAEMDRAPRGSSFVYNVFDDESRDAQVGKAGHPVRRLHGRWKASIKGGYVEDGIPWLNHRLQLDPTFEPQVVITSYPSSGDALAAEADLRDKLRLAGWHVSSMV